jgi:uncharacterized protein
MIVVDANLLIYAYTASSPEHTKARRWVETAFSGKDPVRIPWSTIHAFLRITTQSALFERPYTIADAASIVESWLEQPSVAVLEQGNRYWPIFHRLLRNSQVRGNLVMDAHLAALSIEHGATLFTTDRDFARFDELRVTNPLLAK